MKTTAHFDEKRSGLERFPFTKPKKSQPWHLYESLDKA